MRGRLQLKPGQAQKAKEAMRALYGPAHTPESLAQQEQAIAREYARNEAEKREEQDKDLFA